LSELIKWEEVHYVYILPLKESEDSNFVIFLEVDEKLIRAPSEEKDKFLNKIREALWD